MGKPRINGVYIGPGEGLAALLDNLQGAELPKGALAVAATTEVNLASTEAVQSEIAPTPSAEIQTTT